MAEREEEIEHLKGRLQWEGAGPLTELSNQAATALLARLQAFVQSVRVLTEEHPLISLLCAFEIGFAVGRWVPRRAKH
jgi:hypothetical protein